LFYYGGVRVAHRVSLLGSVEFIFLFYYGGVRVAHRVSLLGSVEHDEQHDPQHNKTKR
jgi:hypothetical protein